MARSERRALPSPLLGYCRDPSIELSRQAEAELEKLVSSLKGRAWHRAAEYVLALKKRLFGYLEFWLETGLIVPRTNSFLERMMRELGRRIKRIGFGWSFLVTPELWDDTKKSY